VKLPPLSAQTPPNTSLPPKVEPLVGVSNASGVAPAQASSMASTHPGSVMQSSSAQSCKPSRSSSKPLSQISGDCVQSLRSSSQLTEHWSSEKQPPRQTSTGSTSPISRHSLPTPGHCATSVQSFRHTEDSTPMPPTQVPSAHGASTLSHSAVQ
jgi:hypothetical protein